MCDEPSLGLAPVIVDDMFDIFLRINKEKHLPILIVEQNAFMALEVSSRCYVLENGRMVITASSEELAKSDTIKKSYLGRIKGVSAFILPLWKVNKKIKNI